MRLPPERIELDHADKIALKRATVDDAEMIARAVSECLEHLHRFMPWARDPNSCYPAFQRERLDKLADSWERGEEFQYVLCPQRDPQTFLAALGMMTRLGPGTLELGYWVHVDHEGKGYIRAACKALTEICLQMDGIEVVYICCNPENTRSLAVPLALGFNDEGLGEHPSGISRIFTRRK